MTKAPTTPAIYHITHVDNLAAIIKAGGLLSDAEMIKKGGPTKSIGMGQIKHNRLRLPVKCHKGDMVGDYVPFYFCPRSIMLYLLHMANHPGLTYRGGQGPIVHLEADLADTLAWADENGRRWAFALSNAGSMYAEFRRDLSKLGEVNWDAVRATDFRDPVIKEGKQAEFLVQERFPWDLVRRIGVISTTVHSQVVRALSGKGHRPTVEVIPGWYY